MPTVNVPRIGSEVIVFELLRQGMAWFFRIPFPSLLAADGVADRWGRPCRNA